MCGSQCSLELNSENTRWAFQMHSKPRVGSISSISIINSSTVRHWVSYYRSMRFRNSFTIPVEQYFHIFYRLKLHLEFQSDIICAPSCGQLRRISNIPRKSPRETWWKLSKLLSQPRGINIFGVSSHSTHLSPFEFEISNNANCMRGADRKSPPESVRGWRYKSFDSVCIF